MTSPSFCTTASERGYLNSTRSPVKAAKPAPNATNVNACRILDRDRKNLLDAQRFARIFSEMELVGPPGLEPGTDGL